MWEGVDGASQVEGILSTVTAIERGALLCVQVWPEPGAWFGVTAGDRGRGLDVKGLHCHWSEITPVLQIQEVTC